MHKEVSTYQRLQNELRDIIEISPRGTKLPSEPKLAEQLGVSRATLREAMRMFEGQGLVRRKQGVGTFVVKPSQIIKAGLEVLESIDTLAKKVNLDIIMEDLKIDHFNASETQAEELCLSVGDPIIEISRVILADRFPVAYLVDVLPEHIIPPYMFDNKFTGSVLDLLIKMGSPTLSKSVADISAVHAETQVAKVLNIQRGDTLLLLSGLLFDNKDHPVDFSHTYLLPGYFRLQVKRKIGSVN